MLQLVFVFCAWVTFESLTTVQGQDKMGGPGEWSVLNVARCQEDSMYTIKVDVTRYKSGRTTDSFNATILLDRDITNAMGVRMDISKMVDGGAFQAYQTLADNDIEAFIKNWAENNMVAALTNAQLDPAFPIPKGEVNIVGLEFDFSELPPEAVYGEFKAKSFLIEDSKEIACTEFHVKFEANDDES